jgi:hypothetical protein
MRRAHILPERPRRNLVILRVGDQSPHPQWIAAADRNFDLMVSYDGQLAGKHRGGCDLYETRRGPKWPCLGELLDEHPELVDQYDAVWLPDDTLEVDTATLCRMFDLFHAYQLQLAQPALTRHSDHSSDTVLRQESFVLRHVGVVDVMAPLFSRAALRLCRDTFHYSRHGRGLDVVWAGLLDNSNRRSIGILDATPVHHFRPIRPADGLPRVAEADPREDERRLLARYGRQAARLGVRYAFFGGVAEVGAPLWTRLCLAWRLLGARRRRRHQVRDLVI